MISHLVANNQFCTNCSYITTSTNQKWDVFSCDPKRRGSKCSLGTISLSCSCFHGFGGSVLISSYPPVPLLVGTLTVASSWVVTIGRLVVEYCTSPCPAMDAMFKVKLASFWKKNIMELESKGNICWCLARLSLKCVWKFWTVYSGPSEKLQHALKGQYHGRSMGEIMIFGQNSLNLNFEHCVKLLISQSLIQRNINSDSTMKGWTKI